MRPITVARAPFGSRNRLRVGSRIVHLTLTKGSFLGGSMITSLMDLIGGWREVRVCGGFSYQISRNGKRRVVSIEDYRKPHEADQQWVETGTFTDDGVSRRFREFSF